MLISGKESLSDSDVFLFPLSFMPTLFSIFETVTTTVTYSGFKKLFNFIISFDLKFIYLQTKSLHEPW